MPPTPQRASNIGGPNNVDAARPTYAPSQYPPQGGISTPEHEQTPTIAEFFPQAVDGAVALVRADGGEIATLDDSGHMLVLRARGTRPRVDPSASIGSAARKSQPQRAPQTGSGLSGS